MDGGGGGGMYPQFNIMNILKVVLYGAKKQLLI